MMQLCKECNEPLMSFEGHYIHIDKPCSGLTDAVQLDMTIADEGLQESFESIYGKPDKDDYEVRIELEKELEELKIEHLRLEATIEGNWFLRHLWKCFKW